MGSTHQVITSSLPPSYLPPPPRFDIRYLNEDPSSLKAIGKREKKQIVRCKRMRLRCYATPAEQYSTTTGHALVLPHVLNRETNEKFATLSSEIHGDNPKERHFTPHLRYRQVNGLNEAKGQLLVDKIRRMLESMNDGEISLSPYDTAWVAMVEAIDGSRKPQFPESLEWISENQLEDGSWGDHHFFEAHDRLLNTLACVIALTCWKIHPHKCCKGIAFIGEKMGKLGEAKEEQMPAAFELIFPMLMEMVRGLGIHLPPDESGVLQDIYAKGKKKLSRIPKMIKYRIPKEVMHKEATTLLYSLEGIRGLGLNWNQLMKFQHENGSFLCSPASTAFALMQTNDFNCFSYLRTLVHKFDGGVPHTYPVDTFERLWVVDRLQRLGISRFFEPQITACLDYVFGYWSEFGIGAVRNSNVSDIDDTGMGFRLLRLRGYNISPDVLRHFERNGEFFCYGGQSVEGVTEMLNLYRASQLQFPGETVLEEARLFSSNYLTQKRASNQLFDKWVIPKDLPGEVAYALDLPWYASLPRIESRFYIEHYGGQDDVWIGKTLYRMPFVSNNMYLELAKLDYNACQTIHLNEWESLRRWYTDYNVKEFGLGERELLRMYFVAAASIFEPERSNERVAWAKTWAITTAIAAFFKRGSSSSSSSSYEERQVFALEFSSSYTCGGVKRGHRLMSLLEDTLNKLSLDVLEARGIEICHHLHQAWEKWMVKWAEDEDEYKGVAELVARTIQACSKNCHLEAAHIAYNDLLMATANQICQLLSHLILQNDKQCNPTQEVDAQIKGSSSEPIPSEVNSYMQSLVELVLSGHTSGITGMKHVLLAVARGYYYSAYCSPDTIDSHIAKVLFNPVE